MLCVTWVKRGEYRQMTIEEIKAELQKKIDALERDSDFENYDPEDDSIGHVYHGMVVAYDDVLRLLNDWNGK